MRLVPPQAAGLAVVAASAILIAGCGGSASPQSNVAALNAAGPATSSAAPPPAASSTTSSPPSSGSTSSPAPPPTPSPGTPTGNMIANIEQMSGWDSCDTCSGGGTISFSMMQALSYPQPGTTSFSLGQGASWGHALWWRRLGNDPTPSHFVLTLDQYMENANASFGIEYDANQIVDGEWYDFAIQCSFGYGIWQLWDDANQVWVPTSVPCARPAPSTHSQIRLEFERSNGQAHFVSIGVNGNAVPVNAAFNPQPSSGLNGDFGVHIQLNANGNPDPYSVWVHGLTLNYW